MDWIDIACNLSHASFGKDLPLVLQRARQAGVAWMVVPGCSVGDSVRAVDLCQQHNSALRSTVGVHPHNAKQWTSLSSCKILDLSSDRTVTAIGETGLDYCRNFSTRNEQILAFCDQIEIAARTQLPLFTHERDAHADFYDILKNHRSILKAVVVHCFTGDQSQLKKYLDLDCHIGITGWICDERRGIHLHELMQYIPQNRLMIETDAPYLLPRNLPQRVKNRRNEPCYLPQIAQTVALCKKISLAQLQSELHKTSQLFFSLPNQTTI